MAAAEQVGQLGLGRPGAPPGSCGRRRRSSRS
jgi:hypothetical protein